MGNLIGDISNNGLRMIHSALTQLSEDGYFKDPDLEKDFNTTFEAVVEELKIRGLDKKRDIVNEENFNFH